MMIDGLILLLIGLAAYFFSRRGQIVGTHPSCAKCGFDLYGLPAGRARCPECGRDILRGGGVVLGQRGPVFWGMYLGALLALCGFALAGAGALTWWTHFDGIQWKTVGMLMGDLRGGNDVTRDKAAKELCRRADAGAVSAANAIWIGNAIMTWQADPSVRWDWRWGDVVESERRDRLLPDASWNRYLTQALQLSLHARTRVSGEGFVPLELACAFKGGGARDIEATAQPVLKLSSEGRESAPSLSPEPLQRFPDVRWDAIWDGNKAPGKHAMHVEFALSLVEASGGVARIERTWDIDYEQLAESEHSVTLRPPSPAEQRDMNEAVDWHLNILPDGHLPIGPVARANGDRLRLMGPPVAVACRVVLRQNGGEWLLAMGLVHANDADVFRIDLPASDPGHGPQPGPAELVCVPDASQAEMTADITEIWGGEFHKAVVLERPGHDGP